MPICRSTVGALSRSRATSTFSASKTLVPFLYQTTTIQQRNPTVQPVAHRNLSSRPPRDNEIPFENPESLPPTIESYFGSSRRNTITTTERAAFEKLYKNTTTQGKQANEELPFNHEIDQIADEWYEEDDERESGATTLDAVFDAVLSGMPERGVANNASPWKGENLKSLAQRILEPDSEKMRKKNSKREVAAEIARVKGIRWAERERVQLELNSARTDRELWKVLQHEVFSMIKQLDLDGLKKQQAQQPSEGTSEADPDAEGASTEAPSQEGDTFSAESSVEPTESTSSTAVSTAESPSKHTLDPKSDPRILFPNFPVHLVSAARLYRIYFPASTLPFSILPTLKSLGRSSYALGATSTLYNNLLRISWVQLSSYDHLNELLTDMDNGGIEFDTQTLETLDWILVEDARAHKGMLGQALANIWRTEHFEQGANNIRRWRDVVAQRLGVWAADAASTRIRPTLREQRHVAKGPRDDMMIDPAESRLSRTTANRIFGHGMRKEGKQVREPWMVGRGRGIRKIVGESAARGPSVKRPVNVPDWIGGTEEARETKD